MKQAIGLRHYTAWQLVKLFWQSEQRRKAYLLFGVTIVLTLTLVAFDVVFSYWFNYFYNALQEYKVSMALYLLGAFCVLAAINIIVSVYRYYLSQILALRWRNWLTEQFIGRWLKKRDYYYLETFDKRTDNPDQRIQEDIGALVSSTLSLILGFIGSVTTFVAFIYVLWGLSGVIKIPMGSWGVLEIPGYLVWVSIIYSFGGTWITFKIGYPLIGLNFEQQRREASFRFAAIDLRSHAENIALYRGEHHQKSILHKLFGRVLDNWYAIILRQKKILWFTAGYNQLAVILPLLVALPNYFNKKFLLGGLMQSLRAFNSLQDAASFFVSSYSQIAEWRAVARRLTTFLDHLQEIDESVARHKHVTYTKQPGNKIIATNVNIGMPDNTRLLSDINIDFEHGKHYLIKGHSGLGKSTFIKVLAGLWPYAAGAVTLPADQKVMFLPQRPYMPIGTLAEAIMFPDKNHPELKAEIIQVLQDCNLEKLIDRLHETAAWSEQLSPGEQQRIAFARVLLHRPDWIVMDESTSMLDMANEELLYKVLKKRLPNSSIISVGHRPSLDVHHDSIIDLSRFGASALSHA